MEQWRKDARKEPIIIDIDSLVPADHLLRKIEKAYCGTNEKGQKLFTTHIWQEYLDIVEAVRKTDLGKKIYAQRKETIERIFADAKEKHAMRYTHHGRLPAVTRWVRLKYAAMNLKKLANWSWNNAFISRILFLFSPIYAESSVFCL